MYFSALCQPPDNELEEVTMKGKSKGQTAGFWNHLAKIAKVLLYVQDFSKKNSSLPRTKEILEKESRNSGWHVYFYNLSRDSNSKSIARVDNVEISTPNRFIYL